MGFLSRKNTQKKKSLQLKKRLKNTDLNYPISESKHRKYIYKLMIEQNQTHLYVLIQISIF